MTTLAKYMILPGADNRPPMLDKDLTKKYTELSATEKLQADCDMKAINIILQGTSLTKQKRECKLYDEFDKFAHIKEESLLNQQTHLAEFPQIDSGLAVPVFKQGDDPIDAINKMMSFLSTAITSRFLSTNNQLRHSSNMRQQATIYDGRVTVQPLQGRQNSYAAGNSGTRGNYSGQQRIVKCFNCQGKHTCVFAAMSIAEAMMVFVSSFYLGKCSFSKPTVLGRAGYDPENEEVKSVEVAAITETKVNMATNKQWLISNLHSSFEDVEVLYHRQECVGLEQLYLSHNSILRKWNAYQCWLTCGVSMFPSISLQQLRIFEKLAWWIDATDRLVNIAGISPAYKLERFVSYEVKLEFLQHTIWKRVKLEMGPTGVYRKWVKLECIGNFSSIQASSTLIEMGQTGNGSNRSISARICLLQFAYHSISHGNYEEARITTT
uniref:Uncharacterized protein n=1 Tax=Tanacetum cinerariifolium TaxID=118510 RepID=A0A699GLP5_TANCI|nr:hypothetical protein [Tanacetum cinerariifolium]